MTPSRASWLVFALFALLAAALHPGVVDNVDSRLVLRTAERLVDARTWSLGDVEGTYLASPEYGGLGPDGSYQMKFGPGNALLDVPFVVAGRVVLGPAGLDAHRAAEAGAAFASCLWFGLTGVVLLRLARRVLQERDALLATLLHGLASYGLVYARSAYLETPLTLAVLLAYDAALRARDDPADRRAAWWIGAAAGAVLWIKHAAVLLLLGVPAVLLAGPKERRAAAVRTVLRAAAPGAALAAAWLALNQARFGSPFSTGYAGSARFDHPIVAGLGDLLFSERGGWLFTAPLAIAGLAALPAFRRRDAGLAAAVAIACLASVPLYAAFFSPFGGDAWGPRYMLPNAALLCVPAAWALGAMLRAGGVRRAAASAAVSCAASLQVVPCVVSFTEVWTALRRTACEQRPGPAAAQILRAEVRGTPVDLSRLGGPVAWSPPREQAGPDWWPVRVAREIPRAGAAGWAFWALTLGGAAFAGACICRARARDEA